MKIDLTEATNDLVEIQRYYLRKAEEYKPRTDDYSAGYREAMIKAAGTITNLFTRYNQRFIDDVESLRKELRKCV